MVRFLGEPLQINQSSLSKNLNLLMEKEYATKENKEYRITQPGKSEYSRILTIYDLDRQSILDEESRRIEGITKKTIDFFKKYRIDDPQIQFRFLNNVLKLDYSRVKSMLNEEEDFDKILLFLSINHPDYYSEYISAEDFSSKYRIKKTTLDYYIEAIVVNKIYPIKFFKLKESTNKYYYFQSDEKLEKILQVVIEEHITKFTYLRKLFGESETNTPLVDIRSTIDNIIDELCDFLFDKRLRKSLEEFLPEYINYLAYKIERERPISGVSNKLEGLIWQEVQTFNIFNQQPQCIDQNAVIYYIDTEILAILESIYSKSIKSLYKKVKPLVDETDYEGALSLVDSALNLNEENVGLVALKANILFYLNRFQEALDLLNDNLSIAEEIPSKEEYFLFFFIFVFCSLTIGDYGTSSKTAENLFKTYPEDPISYLVKAIIQGYNSIYKFDGEELEDSDFSVNIEKAIGLEIKPTNKAEIYQLYSSLLLQLNEESAGEQINEALRLIPDDIRLYHSKIKILLHFNQYDEILSLLNQMLEQFPNYEKDLTLKKASILKMKQNVKEGLDLLNSLLEKYPDDDFILLNKAYWLQYLRRKEECIETVEELIDKSPKSGALHDSYGEILMYFEEYEEAADQFEKAIELEPNGWYIYQSYVKLGICYKNLDYFKLAKENLKKGKVLTNSCFADFEQKKTWLNMADLYLNLIELDET